MNLFLFGFHDDDSDQKDSLEEHSIVCCKIKHNEASPYQDPQNAWAVSCAKIAIASISTGYCTDLGFAIPRKELIRHSRLGFLL